MLVIDVWRTLEASEETQSMKFNQSVGDLFCRGNHSCPTDGFRK